MSEAPAATSSVASGLFQAPAVASGGRDRHLIVALGINGMGKSWLAEQMMAEWREHHPTAPVYAVSKRIPGAYWVDGANEDRKLLYPWVRVVSNLSKGPTEKGPQPGARTVEGVTGPLPLVGPRGAFVLLDDADDYTPDRSKGTPWYCMWTEGRHLRLDLFVTAHRPQGVDKTMLGCAHHLFLFAQQEPYAFEYMATVPSIKRSGLFDPSSPNFWMPSSRGECLHIIQDPKDQRATKIERMNFLKGKAA